MEVALVMLLFLLLGQYILAVILCARYTEAHGRGAAMGAVLGVLFGWLALLGLALILTDHAPPQYTRLYSPPAAPSLAKQLERLADLHRRGALTFEEYETEKRRLIVGG